MVLAQRIGDQPLAAPDAVSQGRELVVNELVDEGLGEAGMVVHCGGDLLEPLRTRTAQDPANHPVVRYRELRNKQIAPSTYQLAG